VGSCQVAPERRAQSDGIEDVIAVRFFGQGPLQVLIGFVQAPLVNQSYSVVVAVLSVFEHRRLPGDLLIADSGMKLGRVADCRRRLFSSLEEEALCGCEIACVKERNSLFENPQRIPP
jgi:hypothetical protein